MVDVPHWDSEDSPWDDCFIGGRVSPGVPTRIENFKPGKRKLDIKKTKGRNGASYVDNGYDPGSFTIVCVLVRPLEFSNWCKLLDLIQPRKGQPVSAISVVHPQLAMVNITSCYVTEIGFDLKPGGLAEGKLMCTEFMQLGKTTSGGKIKKTGNNITDKPLPSSVPLIGPQIDAARKAVEQNFGLNPKGTVAAHRIFMPSSKVKPPKP